MEINKFDDANDETVYLVSTFLTQVSNLADLDD